MFLKIANEAVVILARRGERVQSLLWIGHIFMDWTMFLFLSDFGYDYQSDLIFVLIHHGHRLALADICILRFSFYLKQQNSTAYCECLANSWPQKIDLLLLGQLLVVKVFFPLSHLKRKQSQKKASNSAQISGLFMNYMYISRVQAACLKLKRINISAAIYITQE